MGQPVSLFLVRTASILMAVLLLFAAFTPARAENLDGYGIKPLPAPSNGGGVSNYGRVPVPEPSGPAYSPAAAANNSYNAAPVGGGYYQPAPGYGAAPVSPYAPPAPTGYAPQPVSDGYVPAAGGYNAGLAPGYAAQPVYQPPQPVYQQPAYQPQPVYQSPAYRQPAAQQPAYQPQVAAATPYGYRPGHGAPPTPTTLPQDSAYNYYQGGNYQPQIRPENADYILGPGDKLKLTVFEEADLSGDYTIDGTGFVRLPLIGQVRASGLNSTQLEAAIASSLSRGYLKQPRVSVQVATYRPFYIIGAVAKPGEYPYVNNMNALNAIALAGGYTPSAVESAIYIRREASNIEVKMPVDRSTLIRPGDVVRVNTTLFADAMQLMNPLSTPLSIAAAAAIP